MVQNDLIEELIHLDRLSKDQAVQYPEKRFLHPQLKYLLANTRQMAGIMGLRGTGKTIMLRQLAVELDKSFYISGDTLPVGTDLFELSSTLFSSFGIRYLMIDEIHTVKDWQGQLKKIHDFLDLKILFTSSSSLELSKSKFDLSRRLTLFSLPLFSFREYLIFSKKADVPLITVEEILTNHKELYHKLFSFESYFRTYSELGAFPACLDSPLRSVVISTIDMVTQKDMLTVSKLSQEDIQSVRAILLFIARAGTDGCSYSSIARNVGITKYKAQQFIGMMEEASLLKILLPHGTNVMPEPKIMLVPVLRSSLAQGIDEDRLIGAMREEFFIHHVTGAGFTVNYLKSKRGQKLPDYVLYIHDQKLIIEIGGAGKGTSQFKGVVEKEKLVLTQPGFKKGIPLILFGFLW
ncbi:MAG TPA: AAA family ATPase [Bacteroidales bacterium]|nr:AAA family ATPase [Bacteroidales bacterium]